MLQTERAPGDEGEIYVPSSALSRVAAEKLTASMLGTAPPPARVLPFCCTPLCRYWAFQ